MESGNKGDSGEVGAGVETQQAPHRTGPMETASGSGRRKGSNDGNGGGGED